MKKKFKPDNQIRFYARPGWYILFISDICLAIWAAHGCATEGLWLEAVIGAFFILLGVWGLWQGYREFWELFWASITISETEIVWSCPLRPTHVIQVDDCIIGMENEISGWNMTYPHIYFSKQPYPREFSNKIQKIPNSDNFIKFRYRADLADYLVEHLPKQKTFQVAYYRECEKREAKKRRWKKRK